MTRIIKIGSTTLTADESLSALSLDELRERLKSSFPEVTEATIREHTDPETGVQYVEFLPRAGRKG